MKNPNGSERTLKGQSQTKISTSVQYVGGSTQELHWSE